MHPSSPHPLPRENSAAHAGPLTLSPLPPPRRGPDRSSRLTPCPRRAVAPAGGPPASPHVVGVPSRELADILVHVLEALLSFLQLLLQRAHRHRHPARSAA